MDCTPAQPWSTIHRDVGPRRPGTSGEHQPRGWPRPAHPVVALRLAGFVLTLESTHSIISSAAQSTTLIPAIRSGVRICSTLLMHSPQGSPTKPPTCSRLVVNVMLQPTNQGNKRRCCRHRQHHQRESRATSKRSWSCVGSTKKLTYTAMAAIGHSRGPRRHSQDQCEHVNRTEPGQTDDSGGQIAP